MRLTPRQPNLPTPRQSISTFADKLHERTIQYEILSAGLGGFAITMLVFSFVERLSGLYVERFLSGVCRSCPR